LRILGSKDPQRKFSIIIIQQIYIPAAFLKHEMKRISTLVDFDPPGIEKLTGDNSKQEKERVMELFKQGSAFCR
jgi:hypothetical protein